MRNRVQLIGNIGKAPERVATTHAGKAVVRFTIAQDVSGMDPATQKLVKKDAQWFQVACFASVAERALSLAKGELVLVSGELRSRSYQNDAGERRTSFEITAHEVLRVTRLRKNGSGVDVPVDTHEPEVDFSDFESEAPIA